MSRTYRKLRPQMDLDNRRTIKKARDGAIQYISTRCSHNNGCDWCSDSRLFSTKRREPIQDVYMSCMEIEYLEWLEEKHNEKQTSEEIT